MPEIQIPETAELKQEATQLVAAARAVVIGSDAEYTAACEQLQHVVRLRQSIVFKFREAKAAAHTAHKAITKLEGDLLAYPTEAERILKAAVRVYLAEEQRKRREEELRLQADLQKREEDEVLKEAELLSDAGDTAGAEQLLSRPVMAPVVQLQAPKAEGISSRHKWTFRILDESKIDRRYLQPDLTKIRKQVEALGLDAAELVGGIEVYDEPVIAVRTS